MAEARAEQTGSGDAPTRVERSTSLEQRTAGLERTVGLERTAGTQTTPDGHHIVVNGRTWRATDPAIPEALRTELVKELMAARRLVKARGDDVRFRVQDAKVALGERGDPWWEPTEEGRRERLAATMRALLRQREGKTICPSDAARVVGGEDWRPLMDMARAVAGELAAADVVVVTQKGEAVDVATAKGPIRLAAGPALAS